MHVGIFLPPNDSFYISCCQLCVFLFKCTLYHHLCIYKFHIFCYCLTKICKFFDLYVNSLNIYICVCGVLSIAMAFVLWILIFMFHLISHFIPFHISSHFTFNPISCFIPFRISSHSIFYSISHFIPFYVSSHFTFQPIPCFIPFHI